MLAALLPLALAAAGPVLDFEAPAGDPAAREVRAMAEDGAANVARFFGRPFLRPIRFRLVPSRAAFDALMPADMGAGECWMVGMGTAELMAMLSPTAWAREACEHDARDKTATARLIAHELAHVYHGQRNSRGDFAGEDDLAWFIEGVAVLASGQLDARRVAELRAAAAAGKLPKRLDAIWTGKLRYAQAGSLARYVDARWGRARLRALLAARSSREALAMLRVSEAALLEGWRKSLKGESA